MPLPGGFLLLARIAPSLSHPLYFVSFYFIIIIIIIFNSYFSIDHIAEQVREEREAFPYCLQRGASIAGGSALLLQCRCRISAHPSFAIKHFYGLTLATQRAAFPSFPFLSLPSRPGSAREQPASSATTMKPAGREQRSGVTQCIFISSSASSPSLPPSPYFFLFFFFFSLFNLLLFFKRKEKRNKPSPPARISTTPEARRAVGAALRPRFRPTATASTTKAARSEAVHPPGTAGTAAPGTPPQHGSGSPAAATPRRAAAPLCPPQRGEAGTQRQQPLPTNSGARRAERNRLEIRIDRTDRA